MLKTALNRVHHAAGGRMVEYAGWEMPIQYSGVIEESRAVRKDVGMFDVSHMGRVKVSGARVFDFLQHLTANDVAKLGGLTSQYSLMCTPTGGVVDDIILYRIAAEEYLIVWNSSNREKDLAWAKEHAGDFGSVEFQDRTLETAMIAVQGPSAVALVGGLAKGLPADLPRFAVERCELAGATALACRTGYTGEDGFELILPSADAEQAWSELANAGAMPCGLGARDVLRVEAGLPLYGHELSDSINPIEAGLGWVVSKTKSFIGSDVINAVRAEGPRRKLVGIGVAGRIPPREGYAVFAEERRIGVVSSGVFSPTLECGIGFAFVDSPDATTGRDVTLEIRGKRQPARIVSKRFLKDRD